MNGQMMSFSQKKQLVDDFIKKVNPYKKQPGLNFDMRGYAKYVEENDIPGNRVPKNIVEKFIK